MVLQNWRDSYSCPYTDVRLNGAGTGVSPPYMTCAPVKWLYAAYRRWRAHDREKIRTRPGIEVSLDTRVKALREAGGPIAEALGTYVVISLHFPLLHCNLLSMLFYIMTFSLPSFHIFCCWFPIPFFTIPHLLFSIFQFCPPISLLFLISLLSFPSPILQAYVRVRRSVHGTGKVESQVLWGPGSTTL